MDIIAVIILIIVIIIVGAFCIYLVLSRNSNKRERYQKQGKRIVVRDGIDIKYQTLGSEKGAFFTGNLSNRGTNIISGNARTVWSIWFQNIDTGSIYQYQFCNYMWIGRQDEHIGEIGMYFPQNYSVSKTHCKVYEQNRTLWVCDMKSKNHTYVNGMRADTPVNLLPGCILKVGDIRLEVRFEK